MIEALHKIYRKDPWIEEMFKSAGMELDEVETILDEMSLQLFFDTATDQGLDYYEKEAGLKSKSIMTLEDRRSAIEAKWKSSGKVDLYLLQSIADSWRNGEIDVSFIQGKINIEFKGDFGIPTDLQSLKNAIDEVKPSHLAVIYAFRWMLIEDIHNVMAIEDMEMITLDKFAG